MKINALVLIILFAISLSFIAAFIGVVSYSGAVLMATFIVVFLLAVKNTKIK